MTERECEEEKTEEIKEDFCYIKLDFCIFGHEADHPKPS